MSTTLLTKNDSITELAIKHKILRDEDHEFYERELASFVPDRVFDAHAHLSTPEGADALKIQGLPPMNIGYEEFRQFIDMLHPGRHVGALYLAWGDNAEHSKINNEWVGEQTAKADDCRGFLFIRPGDDPEWVRQETKRLGLHGFKCYHTEAPVKPTWEADIPAYLPERLVKVAHEEGWGITLHMVKSRGVADPSNIHWIRHYCETYPNMKLILAHSARGFQPAHNLEGLPKLTGLDNLYFDTSANCEPMAHEAIIRIIGHKKLMYGGDLPVTHMRGRSLSASDSFLWFYEDAPVWGPKYAQVKPALVGHEHLRSLKWACWSARLNDNQIEDIFWNNAAELFELPS